tara:strand:+ start:546 stop:932 length:387 start_codon:yes stop_codon:yes gene_type:complete
MTEIKNKTSNKNFGFFFTAIFTFLSLFFFYKNLSNYFYIFIIISLFFLLITLTKNSWLTHFNNGWFKLGIVLSKLISPIIITIIFYFVIIPFGIIKKIFTSIKIQKNNKSKTYWINYIKNKSNFDNPF